MPTVSRSRSVVQRKKRFCLALPPVLIDESAEEQAEIHRALEQEMKPQNIVEKIFVLNAAVSTFQILRYNRITAAIINSSRRAALESILSQLLREPGEFESNAQDRAAA